MAADDDGMPEVVIDRRVGEQGGGLGAEDGEAELQPPALGEDELQEVAEALVVEVEHQPAGAARLHVEAHLALTAGVPLGETGPLALRPRELQPAAQLGPAAQQQGQPEQQAAPVPHQRRPHPARPGAGKRGGRAGEGRRWGPGGRQGKILPGAGRAGRFGHAHPRPGSGGRCGGLPGAGGCECPEGRGQAQDGVGSHRRGPAVGGRRRWGLFTGRSGFAKGVQGWVSQQKFSPKPTLPNQEKTQDRWQNPPPSGSTGSARL